MHSSVHVCVSVVRECKCMSACVCVALPGVGGLGGGGADSKDYIALQGAAGEFSSPGSTFCADSYFGIRSTPVLPQ